jgi:cytochrome c-type biogenesis protein CcmF
MNQIEYLGEHLWVGQLGHFLIVLGFIASLFSAYSYYRSVKTDEKGWLSMGRVGYIVHGISFFIVIGLIFYAMVNKMYEYIYVYRTVSDHLPMKYLLAAFWEDQEGSFMLWMFWHIILGFVLIKTAKKWEGPVMVNLGLIQAFISSMILGFYIPFSETDTKIGSNPFSLIRDVFEGPIFANADYLTLVTGTGLNPLLQNYWMTIHPPVLFLGFASMSIPFCYAIAGLSTGYHRDLMNVILKWSLFSAFIFGTGILMGSAWAYEALTFGGYWAWDPVENSSLVPWLLILAGVHTNLIANHTGYSYKSTYIYYLLGFVMTLYSTFLTRSGILGETSVHAFTTMGLETQLIGFLAFTILLSLIKFFMSKDIPVKEKEEELFSREFWMFVGALVLLLSGILMTASTSLPVYNKVVSLFDSNFIGKVIEDQMAHHNRFQIWIGVFLGLLSGLSIMLRYKAFNWEQNKSTVVKHLGICLIASIIGMFAIRSFLNINSWHQDALLLAGLFTIISNADYIIYFIKGNTKQLGASLSHIGFGILLIGILFTGLNKKIISTNPFVQKDFMNEEAVNKAIILIKREPFFTSEYWITYSGDTLEGNMRKYQLDFRKVDINNQTLDEFSTFPTVIYSNDFTKIEAPNPGTNHKITYDVFTQAAPPPHMQDIEQARMIEDSLKYLSHIIREGDEFDEELYHVNVGNIIYNHPFESTEHSEIDKYDLTLALPLEITIKRNNKKHTVYPGLGLKDALIFQFPVVVDELGIKIKLNEEAFNNVFTQENELNYESFDLVAGQTFKWKDYIIAIDGFDRAPTHKNYIPKEGDIAIGAQLSLIKSNEPSFQIKPLYIIQDMQPFSIKDYNAEKGIHIRFNKINPQSGAMTFAIAEDNRSGKDIEMFIADDVPRSDILIVQANIFPGINLVWLGSLMMLFGILLSFWVRKTQD